MTGPAPGTRNRPLLTALLSTRPPRDGAEAMLSLVDALEAEGFVLATWQADGPEVRIVFHGADETLTATPWELEQVAAAHQAGHPEAWRALVLPGGDAAGGHRPTPMEPLP